MMVLQFIESIWQLNCILIKRNIIIFDYDGHVHTKLETFTKRNDRYFYHKLSVKYNQDEIEDFWAAPFDLLNEIAISVYSP